MTLQQKNINLILNSYTQKDFLSKIKILSEKSILVEDQEMFSDLYFFMRYLFKIEIDVEKWILERSKHYMSEDEFFARIKINSLNIKNSCDFMIFLHELIEMNFIYVYKRPILRVITSAS